MLGDAGRGEVLPYYMVSTAHHVLGSVQLATSVVGVGQTVFHHDMNMMILELDTGLDEEQIKQHEYSFQVLMLPLTAAPIPLPQLTPTTKWEIQLMEKEAFDS